VRGQTLKVALATNNAVVADGANITVAGVRVSVTQLSGYSAPHTGNVYLLMSLPLSVYINVSDRLRA